jgi:hypothetical protein
MQYNSSSSMVCCTGQPIDRPGRGRGKTRSNELNLQRRDLAKHNEFYTPVPLWGKQKSGRDAEREHCKRIMDAFNIHSGTIIPAALKTLMDLESMWNNPAIFVYRLKCVAPQEWRDILSNPSDRYNKLIQGLFVDRFRSSTAFRIQADVAHELLSEVTRIRNSVLPYGINVEYQQGILLEVSKLKSVLESCAQPMFQFPQWGKLITPTLYHMIASYDEAPLVEYNGEADHDTESEWLELHSGWGSGWDEMFNVTVDSARIFKCGPGSVDCQEIFGRDPPDVLDDFELRDDMFGCDKGVTYEVDLANVVCEVNVQTVDEVSPELLHACIRSCKGNVDTSDSIYPHAAYGLSLGTGPVPRDANPAMRQLKEDFEHHFNSYEITSTSVESVQGVGSLRIRFAFDGVDRDIDIFHTSAHYMHDRYHYLKIRPASNDKPASVILVSVKMNSDARGELLPFNGDLSMELDKILVQNGQHHEHQRPVNSDSDKKDFYGCIKPGPESYPLYDAVDRGTFADVKRTLLALFRKGGGENFTETEKFSINQKGQKIGFGTPLRRAVRGSGSEGTVNFDQLAVVHELLIYGADPNAEQKKHLSILQTAMIRADDDVVKLLIRYGAV